MKDKLTFSALLLLAMFLVLAPTALATTTWYVDGVHGSDSNHCMSPQNACKTIHHAIALAASGDSIKVAAAIYTENLTIGNSLKIIGSGATTTFIDGGNKATVVTIPTSKSVDLSGMTIRNGSASYGGGGGGVSNSGTLTITNTIISGNQASPCNSFHSSRGGGIYNGGTLTIYNSTISGNSAFCELRIGNAVAEGGGIFNGGTVTIKSSTIDGNSTSAAVRGSCLPTGPCSPSLGGGVYNSGTLAITNSTLSSNRSWAHPFSSAVGAGIWNQGSVALSSSTISGNNALGGGVVNFKNTVIVLQNTIVANNYGGNCGGNITSNGYNLSSDNSCNFHNSGDQNNIDPLLGPLQNNGGPTQTMALGTGSPAIDAGNPSGCTDGKGHLLKTDQRGYPRPNTEDIGDKKGCDMGAYERQSD